MTFFLFSHFSHAANVGDIVITEIMYNALSPEAVKEYFEIYNTTNAAINLTGWEIRDE